MWRIWKFIDRSGAAVTVSQFLGIPTVSALLAAGSGYWTDAHSGGPLSAFLIGLIVFMTALWSGIGLVWLWDRRRPVSRRALDSAWGIVTEGIFIIFDPANERYSQVSINIRNMLSWPLRIEVDEMFLETCNRIPDQPLTGDFRRFILQQNAVMAVNFPSYSRDAFPKTAVIKGRIRITCHYGHPDGKHTRTMKRWFQFEQANYQAPVVPLGFSLPFQHVRMPLVAGPEKDDVDVAYVE